MHTLGYFDHQNESLTCAPVSLPLFSIFAIVYWINLVTFYRTFAVSSLPLTVYAQSRIIMMTRIGQKYTFI